MHRVKTLLIIMLLLGGGFFLFFAYPTILSSPSSTGIMMRACVYDPGGNSLGCSNSIRTVGSDVTTIFGSSVAKVAIPSVYAKFNYTGTLTKQIFTATEKIDYDKGVSESFPITANPTSKTFNITLPKSAWSASDLQLKWGSNYGTKLMNVSLVGSSMTMTFSNGITITKPSPYRFVAQFRLIYGQSTVTSTTSTYSTGTTSSTTTSQTSTTTISGGGVTTGTQDVWLTTITSASGGATGNTASNGVIVSIAPDIYFPSSQSIMWASVPVCSGGYFATLITPTTSITMGKLVGYTGSAFSTQVIGGNPYLVQIRCADSAFTLVFNQVVTASPAQPLDAAPSPPFTTTTTTSTTTTGTTIAGCPVLSPNKCVSDFSVVAIQF